jgi:hypothetical protein
VSRRTLTALIGAVCVALVGVRVLAAQAPAAPAGGPLPEAGDIIAKYVRAIGGAAAYASVTSIHLHGTFEVPAQSISGSVDIFTARPSNFLLKVEIGGIGEQQSGFDGTHGWEIDPMSGPALLTGKALQERKDDADFDADLHLPARVKSMKTIDRVTFDEHDAYKVSVVLMSGDEAVEYYDAKTFLQIGNETKAESPLGTLSVTNIARDYRKFGKLLMPATLVERTMGVEQVIHVASIEYNTVPPATFDPPPAIKALIK